jgi:hypothetical protein
MGNRYANSCSAETRAMFAPKKPAPFDQVDFIIAFENGELSQRKIVEGFSHLVSSGIVWQLQGMYGRTARSLIESGYLTQAGAVTDLVDELED